MALLSEIFSLDEMAGKTDWTSLVRNAVAADPTITDAELSRRAATQGIQEPANVKHRIAWLRKEVAKKQGNAPTAPPKPAPAAIKPAPTVTPSAVPTNTATPPVTQPSSAAPAVKTPEPVATPAPEETKAGGDENHVKTIVSWLDKHGVIGYDVNPDTYVINVDGDVVLEETFYHNRLPFKFGDITGEFSAGSTGITSLHNGPNSVGGNFSCSHNSPHGTNKGLTSAVGSPNVVGGTADYENNPITSIEGLPREVGKDLDLAGTKIKSLMGLNKITRKIGRALILGKTAENINDGIAGLIMIRGLKEVRIDSSIKNANAKAAFKILNEHLKSEDRSGPDLVLALQDVGLSQYAKF